MAVLFRQDLANVEAGIYPLPADHDGSLPALIERSRLFFEDLPDVHRRRENGAYWIVDLDSTNGLEVNGLRTQRAKLDHGDKITIGSTEISFRRDVA